jgi:cyclopropane-fatty-acyl-phospholipid synthase
MLLGGNSASRPSAVAASAADWSGMNPFALEQGPWSVRLDFAFYSAVVAALLVWAVHSPPAGGLWDALGWAVAGFVAWTLVEYLLHRFVLHGLRPFKGWHARHHNSPQALIATPTLLTAALFGALVLWPAMAWLPAGSAQALVLGVLAGYLVYITLHHALHHAPAARWLRQPRRWHALHHRPGERSRYGVSVPLWDHVFRTAALPRAASVVRG